MKHSIKPTVVTLTNFKQLLSNTYKIRTYPHSSFSFRMLTPSDTPTPTKPLPAFTDPRLPPQPREQTNDRTQDPTHSTNSTLLVDIELGIILPPQSPSHSPEAQLPSRPPPSLRSRLARCVAKASALTFPFGARFVAAAYRLTAPLFARAATPTGGSQAAPGQATELPQRPPWYMRLWARRWGPYVVIIAAMLLFGAIFYSILVGISWGLQKDDGGTDLQGYMATKGFLG